MPPSSSARYDDEKLGLVKVAKFNYYPCWWESGGMVHLVLNLEKWNALPKSYQAIVAPGLRRGQRVDARQVRRGQSAGAQAAGRRRRRAEAVPAAGHGGLLQGHQEHFAELAAKDAHFKRAFDSVNAFRKEQLPWWQIAEHAYDSFDASPARGRV